MNRFDDYKTTTDLRTHSAINRMALEKLEADLEFKVGDLAFFITNENSMVVGMIIKLKPGAVALDVDGKRWLVPIDKLSLY